MLVISPWAKQNFIDHTFTDQTSVIKFIEENWGVGQLGDSAFEPLSGSGDLMSMFDFNANDQRAPAILLNDQTGEIYSAPQGPQGQQGGSGPQGPKGPRGPKGNPGRTPHVVCKAKVRGVHITVKCVVTGRKKRRHRKAVDARVQFTRGGAVIASGHGPVSGIRLTARHRVRHGLYLLKVTVRGAARDSQVIRL
jgi:phospholipase C